MSQTPKIIDPPGFDQTATWQEYREYVDSSGGDLDNCLPFVAASQLVTWG